MTDTGRMNRNGMSMRTGLEHMFCKAARGHKLNHGREENLRGKGWENSLNFICFKGGDRVS